MPDGSIWIKIKADDEQAHKELVKLNKDIEKTEKSIESLGAKKMPILNQAKELGAQIDAAKEKLETMQSGTEFFPKSTIKAQQEEVRSLQQQWNSVNDKLDDVNAKLQTATSTLVSQKNEAGELQQRISGVSNGTRAMADAMVEAEKKAKNFSKRLKTLMRRVLVFSVFTMALRSVREWMGKVIQTNTEATAAMARLKGALLTLAHPLINVVIPAFTTFLNTLTAIVSEVAAVLSTLSGTTIEESAKSAEALQNETNALEKTGAAAKKASKSLASFDEINKLTGDTSSVSSGGSNSFSDIQADFSALKSGILSSLTLSLSDILFDWQDITAEDILAKFVTGLSTIAGTIIGFKVGGVGGAALGAVIGTGIGLKIANALFDGDGKLNGEEIVLSLVTGLASMVGALIGFKMGGPSGAAIGAVLGAGVILKIKDVLFDGDGTLSEVELKGMIATALAGIGGGLIGFLLGGIGGAAIGMVLTAGIVAKIIDFSVTAGKTGDVDKIMIGIAQALLAFTGGIIGALTPLGVGGALIGGAIGIYLGIRLEDAYFENTEKTSDLGYQEGEKIGQSVLDGTNDTLGINSPSTEFEDVGKYSIQGLKNGIESETPGLNSTLETTLSGMKTIFDNFQNSFLNRVDLFSQLFNIKWRDIWTNAHVSFVSTWNNISNDLQTGINNALSALNELFEEANNASGLTGKSYSFARSISIANVPIPYLAQGAVIPPNREFLAVLGDQKSGTNIETPLSTMVDAFRIAMRDMGGSKNEAQLVIDGEVLGKIVYSLYNKENRRIGVNLSTR